MIDLLRRLRFSRIARLLGLAATPFVFSTCELVNQPGAAGGEIAVTFGPGFTTMVVGRKVAPQITVTQGGNPVPDPRLVIVSSDPQVIAVDGSSVNPIARGTAKLHARLVTSTLGQNPPGDSITVTVIAAAIRTDTNALTLKSINETATIAAHALDNAGGNISAPITWTSDNPAVATVVDSTGVIKAISNGGATITAAVDGRTATIGVTVSQQLARFEFAPNQVIFASLNDTLTVTVTPKDAGGTTIPSGAAPPRTLTSTFPSRASVTPAGRITSLANGTAGVEARSGTVADTLGVQVSQVAERVVITGPDSVLIEAIGDTTKLIALASDDLSGSVLNANPNFRVVSADAGLVIVDPLSGVVRSLAVGGPARVIASLDNGADTVRVYVTNEPRVLEVTPVNVQITAVGDATQLAGTPLNRLGAILPTIPVTWGTTDPAVATVNGAGLVTATGVGTGRIVGTALGGLLADTAVINVVNSPDSVEITSADSVLTSFDDTWVPAAVIKNSRNAPLARNAVDWASDDPGIATVSPLGLVRAVSAGVVKIRATNPLNAARTDSVTVTVSNEPISISLNRTLDTLTSPTKTLTYVADSRNARGVQVDATAITWRSTIPGVATVAAGVATAVAPGTTLIISEVTGGSGLLADTSVLVVRNAPKNLTVSPTAAQLTFVGATQQITPSVLNDLGNPIPGSVLDWESSNSVVASVSGTGLVTALAVGTTIITVKVGNLLDTLSASTSIEVSNAPASIDIAQASVTLASINDSFPTTGTYLSGQGVPLPAGSASWTSDDPGIAEVTSAGIIIARARGTTTVRATSPLNASVTDAVGVTVTNAPVSLALNRTSDNLSSLGRTLSYAATVLNARGSQIPDELVTWTSTVPGVASLAAGNAQDNLATALTVGSTSVIAAVGTGPGLRADTATLNVANTAVSVAITPAPANISAVGGQIVLTATARNELGNVIPGAPATWASLNTPVATVTSPGPTTTVTGAGVGSVTITATVDGVTAQITVSVANDLVSMSIVPDTTLQSVNDTLLARVNFRNGVNDSLPEDVAVWTSTDINVASVSSNGTIVARGAGTAVIRAASPLNAGTFDELTVTVTNAPATISLTRNDTTLTAIGRTLEYGAQVRNARTDLIGGAVVTWSSTTPGVASVDPSTGLATALTVGTTNIRGTASNGIFAQKLLTVTNNAASVSVSPASVTITSIGSSASVTPTVRNDLGNAIVGATVTWAVVPAAGVVSVPGGATSGAQNITATGAGSATVTITAGAGVTTSLPVTVRDDPTTVDFGTTTAVTLLNLRRTDDLFANAQTTIQNALNADLPASSVIWTTTNASVATVSAAGVVTGVGAGTAIIAATSPVDPTKTDMVTYTVQAPAYSITLNQSVDSLTALTQSRIYTATVRDSLGNVLPGVGGAIAWTDANNAGPKVTFTPTTGFSTTATAAAVSGATRATLTATVTPTTALVGATLAASVDVGVGNDPASVTVTPASVTITSVAATASITPTVRNNLGNAIAGATVTWAVVPAAGVVSVPGGATSGAQNITATGAGSATVTITAGAGVTTSFPVTVRDDPTTVDFGATTAVTLLNLRRTDDLFANAQTTIQNALSADLPASSVIWTTTDASVATVSAAGVVTGVGAGTAVIAATSPVDPSKTDAVTYTVQAPAYSITLNQSVDSLTALTQSRIYTATVRDSVGNVLPGVGGAIAWTDANNAGPKVTFTPTTGFSTTATAAVVSGATRATLTATVTPSTVLTGATLAASVDVGVGNDPASVTASPSSVVIGSIGGIAAVTPTVRNNLGLVIAGAEVTWTVAPSGVVSLPAGAATGTTGTQNLTSVATGTAIVTITAKNTSITTTIPVTVTQTASGAQSTISASPTTIETSGANGTPTSSLITVQLKDAGGTNLSVGGHTVVLNSSVGSLTFVADQGNGTYTATLTSATAGTANITGTVNGVGITGATASVTVLQAPSGAQSTISASPTTVENTGADGSLTSSTITVQLKSVGGVNLTHGGDLVVLNTSLGSLSAVTDNGDGTYTSTLTSATTGTANITGTVNGAAITGATASVTVIQAPSGAQSTITATPTTIETDDANGTPTSSTITVQLKSPGGVNLTHGGDAVVLNTTVGSLGVVTDNGDGTYTATLTSATAGTATITGTVNGAAITDDATITILQAPSAAQSTITAVPATIETNDANGTPTSSTITVQLKSAAGANITHGGDVVVLNTDLGSLSVVTDNGDGTYTATLTSATAGTATITGTVNGTAITDNAIVTVLQAPSAAQSTITAAPTTIETNDADGSPTSSTITVQLKSAAGANITHGGDAVVLNTDLGSLSVVTDNGDGTYTATLTSATAGTATITGTVNTVAITDNAVVTVLQAPSAAQSTITAVPTTIDADGVATSAITVQLKSAGGANITHGGDAVVLNTTRGSLGTVTDNGDGTYAATLTSSVEVTTETATVTGTVNGAAISDNAIVTFSAASETQSTISASPTTIETNDANGTPTSSTVTVQLKNGSGANLTTGGDLVVLNTDLGSLSVVVDNGDGTYTVTLTSATAGTATITGTVNGASITDNAVVTVLQAPSAAQSTITALPATIDADGVATSTITVQLKSAAGANITHGGDAVVLNTTRGSLGSVTDNGDGTYMATLTSSVEATTQTATVTGTVNGASITDNAVVLFTAADETQSTIDASPATIETTGADGTPTSSTVTVQLKNGSGANLTTGGDLVVLNTDLGALSVVIDNGDGTYTATLTSATAGTATITGTVNGNAITDNALVTVLQAPSGAQSTITATLNTIDADGVATTTITVQLKSAGGANITHGGDAVVLNTTRGSLGTVTDNGDGTYSATLTSSVEATTQSATVTGTVNGASIADNAVVVFTAADETQSTIDASPATIETNDANGSPTSSTVTVQLKNGSGANVTTGGDLVVLNTDLGVLSVVTDNGDGTYTATLTSAAVGPATITGTVNGAAFTDNATVTVLQAPSGAQSVISATAPVAGSSDITVQLKDGSGINLTHGGDVVVLNTDFGVLSAVTDNLNGTYSATLTSGAPGSANVTGTVNNATIGTPAVVVFP